LLEEDSVSLVLKCGDETRVFYGQVAIEVINSTHGNGFFGLLYLGRFFQFCFGRVNAVLVMQPS